MVRHYIMPDLISPQRRYRPVLLFFRLIFVKNLTKMDGWVWRVLCIVLLLCPQFERGGGMAGALTIVSSILN